MATTEGRTRIMPASVSGPVHASDTKLFRRGLWVIGGVVAFFVVMFFVTQVRHYYAGVSTQSASVGRVVTAGTALDNCTERVQERVLGNGLTDINSYGCYLRWNQYPANGCMNIYNRSRNPLVEDCGGFVDLTKQSPAYFQASRGQTVRVTYVLCKKRGTTNDVVDGCP